GLRPLETDAQAERYLRLPTTRQHLGLLMEGRGDAKRVPGTIGPVALPCHLHPVWGLHPREGRSHANGLAIRLEQHDTIALQPAEGCPDLVRGAPESGGQLGESRRVARARERLVDG